MSVGAEAMNSINGILLALVLVAVGGLTLVAIRARVRAVTPPLVGGAP